ncbi:hypothetical protein [Limnochorda pilosa]|uniref:Uncharacterized protein n=1 Tax=Limnochorda pilosa TaxID=1555112 RepID=A0A0K2SP84_LIMPI|nr:hypothetical protein [Limnochorda pilosa]BAS28948.1 hypothetical protein LIP_3120 [Limnochorda pilosa]
MDRALGGVAVGLAAVFVLLAWGVLVAPAGLLVKLLMFLMLTAATFAVTLVMTTESPLADAVLKPPEDVVGAWAGEAEPAAGEAASEEAAEAPDRPRARAAARVPSGRGRREARSQGPDASEPARGVDV